MPKHLVVFYAFPGEPPSIAESIHQTLTKLKDSPILRERNVRFQPWTSMSIAGKSLIGVIAKNIERAELFACDLTYPNFNVSFELGYAIGKFKRIWLQINTTIQDAPTNYKGIYSGLLGGLGYVAYSNHIELVNAFVSNPPWAELDATPLGSIYRNKAPAEERPTLLYIKPPLNTEAVISTVGVLESSIFGNALIVDDSRENPSPPLEWYAGNIRTADAVLVQLLAGDQRNATNHNLKCSFVAGLTYAFNKPLLMVAPSPFEKPLDYQHLLRIHDTGQRCLELVQQWITSLEPTLPKRRARRPGGDTGANQALDLRKLSVGDPVAEIEERSLDEYFVETGAYYRALEGPTTIVVGRRGTGKTANLFAMRAHFGRDRRNHVCVVKPVGYEIDGLVRVLNENLDRSERGYLIESLWKYLIFSELALSVSNEIESRSIHVPRSDAEQRCMTYVTDKRDSLFLPFSERLDRAVKSVIGVGDLPEAMQQRRRISEMLHSGELKELRELLGLVLANRHRVAILVDNLDEPWGPGAQISHLSELILGLLNVADDISDEFQHQDHWRKRVNVSVTVFLRSDIFALIQPLAAEQDKLPLQRLVWDDPEVLLRVLNERIQHAMPKNVDAEAIWKQLFPTEVVGVPTSEFITRTVLPRPRDVVYLVRAAIDGAVNRGHQTVTPDDFLQARNRYSEFVFRSVLAEDDPRVGKLEAVLFEFAGAPKIIRLGEAKSRIARTGANESEIEFYIDLLCDVSFLGIQGAQGFRYALHEGDRHMMREVAKRLAVNRLWEEESFEVNAAFHQVLQIE